MIKKIFIVVLCIISTSCYTSKNSYYSCVESYISDHVVDTSKLVASDRSVEFGATDEFSLHFKFMFKEAYEKYLLSLNDGVKFKQFVKTEDWSITSELIDSEMFKNYKVEDFTSHRYGGNDSIQHKLFFHYQNSGKIVAVSKPLYNSDDTLALFYYSYSSGFRGGASKIVAMQKVNDKWIMLGEVEDTNLY